MKKISISSLIIFSALLGLVFWSLIKPTKAGDLTPPGNPAATMQSLSDLAGSGFSSAAHSLKALYDWLVENLKTPLTGDYNSSSVDADGSGNIIERLEFIQQNLGGYAFGSSDADDVLVSAGGDYATSDLIPANIRQGVHYGDGNGNLVGTYGGGSWTYGSDEADEVLTTADAQGTFNAANLSSATVKAGTTFGVGQTGDFPSSSNPLSGDTAATDATAAKICNENEAWAKSGSLLTGTLNPAADTIAVGNSYCGVAGSLLKDQFNGSQTGFTGGSQANGGVDDYKNGAAPPDDRYDCPSSWTACDGGNNYCGTNLASADAKDNCTGMIWSLPCNGSGCASFSDSSPLTYSWDASAANNSSKTAAALCSAGTHGESGWSLPHQKQLMQSYIDGSYGNLEAAGVARGYWSATTVSNTTTLAWSVYLANGYTNNTTKTTANYVRCVRSAN